MKQPAYSLRQALPGEADKVSRLIREAMLTYSKESGISPDILESMHESVESVAYRIENNYLNTFLEESIFVGELSLDGSVEKINGVLPICIEAKKLGIKRIILSRKNSKEAAIVDGLEILPVDNLKQLMEYLKGEKYIEKERHKEINDKNSELYEFDFSDVKGQENVKRALEISAAGGHNCILIRKSRCWKNNVSKTISKYITRDKF